MKTSSLIFKNDKGSVIVVGMMILVLLTIIGIAAINTGTFESQIIGNEHRYQIDFYVADSGWKEAAMWLEDSGAPPAKVNSGTDNTSETLGQLIIRLAYILMSGMIIRLRKFVMIRFPAAVAGGASFFTKLIQDRGVQPAKPRKLKLPYQRFSRWDIKGPGLLC